MDPPTLWVKIKRVGPGGDGSISDVRGVGVQIKTVSREKAEI